jgi:hypothetical protein
MPEINTRQKLVELEIPPDKELLLWKRYSELHRKQTSYPLFQRMNNNLVFLRTTRMYLLPKNKRAKTPLLLSANDNFFKFLDFYYSSSKTASKEFKKCKYKCQFFI